MMSSVLPKINGGVITSKLQESRAFYTDVLQFTVKFEPIGTFYFPARTTLAGIGFSTESSDQSSISKLGEVELVSYEVANVEEEMKESKA